MSTSLSTSTSTPPTPTPPPAAATATDTDETELLTRFLLTPAALGSVLTAEQFRALFPRGGGGGGGGVQASPLVRALYRDLKTQRDAALDAVAASVEVEASRGGAAIRREVARQRRSEAEGGGWEEDGEVEMDRALFTHASAAKKSRHTLDSIVAQLDAVVAALEAETASIVAQEDAVKEDLARIVVDGLGGVVRRTASANKAAAGGGGVGNGGSPLEDPRLPEDVRRRLESLREVCNRKV